MRRLGLLVIGAGVAVFGLATPALAEPSPSAAGPGSAAEAVCTLNDNRLTGLSGLIAQSDGGYVVANTSPDQTNPMRVLYLDSKCKVSRVVPYPSANPARDPQDLAVASDGAAWVADTGDNSTNKADRRETIALWKVPTSGANPILHRLTYPDGPHDARALLFGAGDTPIIVTKEPSGTAQIYEPTAPLDPTLKQQRVPLKNVGSWKPRHTGTPNFLAATGQILVTGAAQSPDRKRVVLRTYSDAYEWNVPDGDVVKAITTGEPRVTALAGEAQGEGIAYSSDGKSFLTCSNQSGPSKILRYQPAAAAAAPVAAAAGKPAKKADSRSWYQKLSLPQIINMIAAVGVLGLVLVVVGVIGIRRSRTVRRRAAGDGRVNPPGKGDGGNPRPARAANRPPAAAANQPPAPAGNQPPAPVVNQPAAPVAPPVPSEPRRQGRAVAAPADPQRQGRPADPQRGGPVQPGRGGSGGGNVYGGGFQQSGPDQRGGRQEYAQPGYRPNHDGDGRYFSERL
jgi:hypothetical protein